MRRLRRGAAFIGLWAAAGLAHCADEDCEKSSAPELQPVRAGSVTLRPLEEAQPGDLANGHLSPGTSFEVIKYDVPELPCVRTDTTVEEMLGLPDSAEVPGEAAAFYMIEPADASQPLLLTLHGGALDFIEAEAALYAEKRPEEAAALLESFTDVISFIEVDNRAGAIRELDSTVGHPVVAEALERGWGVVLPGNCWGDGGHGEGEIVDYYISAPRYGHHMDRGVWDWFRANVPHDSSREYTYGCSGGGQRSTQLILRDQEVAAASIIDSPADYLTGWLEPPLPGIFGLFAGVEGFDEVLEGFYVGHFGSLEGARQNSLGTQLLPLGIDTPIYLARSDQDPMTTEPMTQPLADALAQREPKERAKIFDLDEAKHCQIDDRDRAKDAIDWLLGWTTRD